MAGTYRGAKAKADYFKTLCNRSKPIIRAKRIGNKIGWYFYPDKGRGTEMKFWSTDLADLMNYLCTVYRW